MGTQDSLLLMHSDEVIGYRVSNQAVEMRAKEARTLRKTMLVASSQG